jgi:hypothetical protein
MNIVPTLVGLDTCQTHILTAMDYAEQATDKQEFPGA